MFTRFLPLEVFGDFSRRSRAANSALLGPIWPKFELVRDVMDVLVTCKYEEDPIKNEGARVVTIFSPIITLWELSVAMDTRVPIRSSPKPNAWPFPHRNNSSIKILLRLTHWLQRYSTLKMSTDTQTDTQTDDGSTGIL